MIRTIFLVAAMLLLVQSCATGSKQTKLVMPAWVVMPPSDNGKVIFGIGSGYSYNEATQAALKEISGKLITEISSQSQSEMSVHDDLVSRSANEQISTRTLETQISNYKVLKSERVANEIFVQVSMSRQDFIKSTSSRLKELDDRIKTTMQQLAIKSKLQQLVDVQMLLPSVEQARTLVLLLQAAGGKQDTDKYLSYYNGVQEESQALLKRISFNISASSGMKSFAKQLAVLLQNENISASLSNSKKADAVIHIAGDVNSSIMFSQHMANIKVTTRVSEKNISGGLLREFESTGSSLSNKKNAIESALRSLASEIKKNGVLASLGLIENK